jgi:manganese transport protein
MSAKLGIVTGRNLAELCREQFSGRTVIGMWIVSEIAAMATDIAEFIGGALAISLLFHVSLLCGLSVTGVATFLILQLDRRGFRPLELVIAAIVAVIDLRYLWELVIAPPDWHAALFHTVVPQLQDKSAVTLAVEIVGATIIPHTLYLHSGLTQNRTPSRNDRERRGLLHFSNREVVLALGFAGLVKLAMVMMWASVFGKSTSGITDIGVAYHTLIPTLGARAAGVFLIALMASGISSSVVGTMAGPGDHARLCRIQHSGLGAPPDHHGTRIYSTAPARPEQSSLTRFRERRQGVRPRNRGNPGRGYHNGGAVLYECAA